MKISLWIAALVFFFCATSSHAQESAQYSPGFLADPKQEEGSVFLPQGRPFPSLPTDPRDLKLGLRKTSLQTVEGDLGGYRSFYGWKGAADGAPLIFHTGIEGNAYFSMRRDGSKFPLESSDGLFGLYAEAAHNNWFYQLRFSHISAHLADGSPSIARSYVHSREFIVLRAARQIAWLRPYAGPVYLVHTIPENIPLFGIQAGFYAIPDWMWGRASPYFGADFRARGGREGNTTNLSLGILFRSGAGAPPIRIAASYLFGHDLRGQFLDQYIRKFSLGLELDL